MTGLNAEQAKQIIMSSDLSGVDFQDFVRDIVSQTDVSLRDDYSVFLTYSGTHTIHGLPAWQAAQQLTRQLATQGIFTARIDDTQVFNLLMDGDISDFVRTKFLSEAEFNNFWGPSAGSLWDIASWNYAGEVKGPGIALTPFSNDNNS
jgi:hypothetical protein